MDVVTSKVINFWFCLENANTMISLVQFYYQSTVQNLSCLKRANLDFEKIMRCHGFVKKITTVTIFTDIV